MCFNVINTCHEKLEKLPHCYTEPTSSLGEYLTTSYITHRSTFPTIACIYVRFTSCRQIPSKLMETLSTRKFFCHINSLVSSTAIPYCSGIFNICNLHTVHINSHYPRDQNEVWYHFKKVASLVLGLKTCSLLENNN